MLWSHILHNHHYPSTYVAARAHYQLRATPRMQTNKNLNLFYSFTDGQQRKRQLLSPLWSCANNNIVRIYQANIVELTVAYHEKYYHTLYY
jgi:hypothetical protein